MRPKRANADSTVAAIERGIGDVEHESGAAGDFGRRLLRGRLADVGEADARAARGQQLRRRAADAAAGAGDKNRLARVDGEIRRRAGRKRGMRNARREQAHGSLHIARSRGTIATRAEPCQTLR